VSCQMSNLGQMMFSIEAASPVAQFQIILFNASSSRKSYQPRYLTGSYRYSRAATVTSRAATVTHGQLPLPHGQLPLPHGQLPLPHGQLATLRYRSARIASRRGEARVANPTANVIFNFILFPGGTLVEPKYSFLRPSK
jgi:hypothetical protein